MINLTEEMLKIFSQDNLPKTDTELDIWKIIESLGGITWRMNHDAADGRITLSEKDEEFISICRNIQEGLIEVIKTKYNVILPQECPSMFTNVIPPIPSAPKGKIYYWDWYDAMAIEYFKGEYNNIICSACALHEHDGASKMQLRVPCDVYPGVIYHLINPYECAMLQHGHSTSVCKGMFWTEEKLFEEIKKKGGEDSVKRFKQKLILLKTHDKKME